MTTNNLSLNGGVLIIGSLLWDNDQLRENWRASSLNLKSAVHVNVPIRYGRISKERNCTFSMVFSRDCSVPEKSGIGVFVPFQQQIGDFENLETQALELIKAERKQNVLTNIRFNWDWGALAILVNPELLEKSSQKYEAVQDFLAAWSKKYGGGFDPNQYRVDEESPVVNQRGVLQCDWPQNLTGIDFFICTATKPNCKAYPSSKNIADRMTINEYPDYFKNNKLNGIATFQDNEIEEFINGGNNAGQDAI